VASLELLGGEIGLVILGDDDGWRQQQRDRQDAKSHRAAAERLIGTLGMVEKSPRMSASQFSMLPVSHRFTM
jgi:hypothetical protein